MGTAVLRIEPEKKLASHFSKALRERYAEPAGINNFIVLVGSINQFSFSFTHIIFSLLRFFLPNK